MELSDLRPPYFSKNNWAAYVCSDKIICLPEHYNKGKFVILYWNPDGRKGCYPQVFDTALEAHQKILSVDSQVVTVETVGGDRVTVFLDCQNDWWYTKDHVAFHKFYIVHSREEAIALVSSWNSDEELLVNDDIPF